MDQFGTFPGTLQTSHVRPFAFYIETFSARLLEEGYASTTTREQTRLVADLSRWLRRRCLEATALDEQTVARFLQYRRRNGRVYRGSAATLRKLLAHLREAGVIRGSAQKVDDTPLQRMEIDFSRYLAQERGLSRATVINYLPTVRRFLSDRFGTALIQPHELHSGEIGRFIIRHAHAISRGRAKLMVTALRSFFRFLRLRGDITSDLATAVPAVPNWRLTNLPTSIPPEEVESVLKSCNQSTATGQRDHTILLLLARLGLRAGEIVAMRLEDIDWEAGELTIRGKGSRQDRLPLPQDVGEALATYLRHGRTCCSARQVFIRMKAPRRGFASSVAICTIVRRALARAGLAPPHKGAHLLRHSLATQMLSKGASLSEIGEILRHQQPNTTQIYTKVDLAALRTLAQPWPGEES